MLISTPKAPVTGTGEAAGLPCAGGVPEACDAGGVGEWLATLLVPPPHAATTQAMARTRAALCHGFLGAETRGCVPISKGNDIVRVELRFRYYPASKAGRRPSPPGRSPKGFPAGCTSGRRARAGRTPQGAPGDGRPVCCPFCFIGMEE